MNTKKIIIILIAIMILNISACKGEDATIKYIVNGTSLSANVKYISSNGELESNEIFLTDVELPWSNEFKVYNPTSDYSYWIAHLCAEKLTSDDSLVSVKLTPSCQ